MWRAKTRSWRQTDQAALRVGVSSNFDPVNVTNYTKCRDLIWNLLIKKPDESPSQSTFRSLVLSDNPQDGQFCSTTGRYRFEHVCNSVICRGVAWSNAARTWNGNWPIRPRSRNERTVDELDAELPRSDGFNIQIGNGLFARRPEPYGRRPAKTGCQTEQQTGLRQPTALLRATASFDPAASTLSTQLLRYAIRSMSGGRSRNQRRGPPQALGDGGQNKLILGASWTTQSKSAELQDALQVRKPHLDLLALASRLLEASVRANDGRRPGRVHGCRAGSCAMGLLDSTAV